MRSRTLHFAIKEYLILIILLCLAICLFISSAFALDSIVNFKKGPEPEPEPSDSKNMSKARRHATDYNLQRLKDENEEFKKLRFSASVFLIGAFLELILCFYFLNKSRKKLMYSALWIDFILILTFFLICFGTAASCSNDIRNVDPEKEKHYGKDWNIRMEILSHFGPLNAIVLLLLIGYLVGKNEEKLNRKRMLREVGPEIPEESYLMKKESIDRGSSDSLKSQKSDEDLGFILLNNEPEEDEDEETEEESKEESKDEETEEADEAKDDEKETEK